MTGVGEMLEQTKRIIDILLDCGFDRRDFSARVQRTRQGYGDILITLFCDIKKAVQLTQNVVGHGLIVEYFVMDGKIKHVSIRPYGTLKADEQLQIINLDEEQKCVECGHPLDKHTVNHGMCIIPDCLCQLAKIIQSPIPTRLRAHSRRPIRNGVSSERAT